MAFEDTIERIKLIDQSKRVAFAAFLGIAIPAYDFWESYEPLNENLQVAVQVKESARIEYERAKKDRERLPELEKQLQFTQEQLKLAQAKLPESFDIDQILQMTAESATGSGIQISLFEPGTARISPQSSDYMEKSIKLECTGKFLQLATFIDRLVHLEKIIHIKNMQLTSKMDVEEDRSNRNRPEEQVRDHETQTRDRERVAVKMSMEIITYKITTPNERASSTINTEG